MIESDEEESIESDVTAELEEETSEEPKNKK